MKTILGVKYYSTYDAAKLLDISPHSIRRHVREKKLPARKIGNGYYIREDHFREYYNV